MSRNRKQPGLLVYLLGLLIFEQPALAWALAAGRRGWPIHSREDFKRFLEQDWGAVPDGRITPFGSYSGTQTGRWGPIPPSNRRFQLDFSGVFRPADEKIAELWIAWDNLALLTQLGQWPPTQGAPPA
jgi:hypothetical protein